MRVKKQCIVHGTIQQVSRFGRCYSLFAKCDLMLAWVKTQHITRL